MPAASTPRNRASSPLGVSHPLFLDYRDTWKRLLDVYEGSGAFLDPSRPYLEPHPREWLDHSVPVKDTDGNILGYEPNASPTRPSPKLKERRRLAVYENVAATLVDQLQAALFRGDVTRTFKDDTDAKRPIQEFWDDADGLGTGWHALLKEGWKPAGTFGHIFLYLEMVEDRDVPVVRLYTPLDVPDWLTDDRGALIAVKFLEAAPRADFKQTAATADRDLRVRVITETEWELQDMKGARLDGGPHPFGGLPVVPLYARRRPMLPVIGKSVLGDPQQYIDLYNQDSEARELLRKQTFSILNVVTGDSPDGLIKEQQKMGMQTGTGNVLFTSQAAAYLSPDSGNIEAYHASMDRRIRTIYRLALLPWDTDSREAESAESRRIKREDLNQQLAGFADECQRAEKRVSELVYRARYGDAWETWWERDGLTLAWPQTFDVTPLMELLDGYERLTGLELGETATKEAKKRAAVALLPDVSEATRKQINEEIDALEIVTEEERRKDELAVKMGKQMEAFGGE
jgi:hypothetical protein